MMNCFRNIKIKTVKLTPHAIVENIPSIYVRKTINATILLFFDHKTLFCLSITT